MGEENQDDISQQKEKLKSLVSSSFQMLTKTTNSSGGKNPPESSSSMVVNTNSQGGSSSSSSKEMDENNEPSSAESSSYSKGTDKTGEARLYKAFGSFSCENLDASDSKAAAENKSAATSTDSRDKTGYEKSNDKAEDSSGNDESENSNDSDDINQDHDRNIDVGNVGKNAETDNNTSDAFVAAPCKSSSSRNDGNSSTAVLPTSSNSGDANSAIEIKFSEIIGVKEHSLPSSRNGASSLVTASSNSASSLVTASSNGASSLATADHNYIRPDEVLDELSMPDIIIDSPYSAPKSSQLQKDDCDLKYEIKSDDSSSSDDDLDQYFKVESVRINDESDTTNDADAAEIQDLIQDDDDEKSNPVPSKKGKSVPNSGRVRAKNGGNVLVLQNLKKSLAKLADKIELDELDTDNENEDSQDKPGPSGIQNNSNNLLVSRVRALLDDPTEDIIITDDEDIQVINEDINVKIVKESVKKVVKPRVSSAVSLAISNNAANNSCHVLSSSDDSDSDNEIGILSVNPGTGQAATKSDSGGSCTAVGSSRTRPVSRGVRTGESSSQDTTPGVSPPPIPSPLVRIRISREGQGDIVTLNEADNRGAADEVIGQENNERQLADTVPINHQDSSEPVPGPSSGSSDQSVPGTSSGQTIPGTSRDRNASGASKDNSEEPKLQLKNISELCWNDINYLKNDPRACPSHVLTRKEREQRLHMKRYIAQKSYREETDENPEIIETDNGKDNEAVQTTSSSSFTPRRNLRPSRGKFLLEKRLQEEEDLKVEPSSEPVSPHYEPLSPVYAILPPDDNGEPVQKRRRVSPIQIFTMSSVERGDLSDLEDILGELDDPTNMESDSRSTSPEAQAAARAQESTRTSGASGQTGHWWGHQQPGTSAGCTSTQSPGPSNTATVVAQSTSSANSTTVAEQGSSTTKTTTTTDVVPELLAEGEEGGENMDGHDLGAASLTEDHNNLDTNDVGIEEGADITDHPAQSQSSPGQGEPEKNPSRNKQQYQSDLNDEIDIRPGCSHWTDPVPSGSGQGQNLQPQPIPAQGTGDNDDAPVIEDDESMEGMGGLQQQSAIVASSQGVTSMTGQLNWEEKFNNLYQKYSLLINQLQSLMECPICFEVPKKAPIPCCRNGHIICSTCLESGMLQQCPACKIQMSSTNHCVSNLGNSLLDLVPHPCKFKNFGCQFEDLLGSIKNHEKNCRHRDIRCPYSRCNEFISMSLLPTHFDHHSSNVFEVPRTFYKCLNSNEHSDLPFRFKYDNRMCFLQVISPPNHPLVYYFVQMEGSVAECCQYKAHIQILGEENQALNKQSVFATSLDVDCTGDLQRISTTMILTKGALTGHLSEDAEGYKIHINMSKLLKQEGDKFLAKMEKIDESPSARKSGSVTASPVPGSKSSGQTVTTAQAQTRVKSSTFSVQDSEQPRPSNFYTYAENLKRRRYDEFNAAVHKKPLERSSMSDIRLPHMMRALDQYGVRRPGGGYQIFGSPYQLPRINQTAASTTSTTAASTTLALASRILALPASTTSATAASTTSATAASTTSATAASTTSTTTTNHASIETIYSVPRISSFSQLIPPKRDILPALPLPSRAFHGPLSASASGSAATPGSSNPVPGPSSTTARGSGGPAAAVSQAQPVNLSSSAIKSETTEETPENFNRRYENLILDHIDTTSVGQNNNEAVRKTRRKVLLSICTYMKVNNLAELNALLQHEEQYWFGRTHRLGSPSRSEYVSRVISNPWKHNHRLHRLTKYLESLLTHYRTHDGPNSVPRTEPETSSTSRGNLTIIDPEHDDVPVGISSSSSNSNTTASTRTSTSTSTVFDSLRAMANPGRSQQEDSTTRSRHQQDTTRRPDSMISFLNHLRNSRADIDSNTRTIERARGLVEPRAIAEMERMNNSPPLVTVVDRPYLPADPNVFRRRAEAAEPLNTEQQRNDRRDRLLRDMMDRRNQAMQRFQEATTPYGGGARRHEQVDRMGSRMSRYYNPLSPSYSSRSRDNSPENTRRSPSQIRRYDRSSKNKDSHRRSPQS